MKQFLQNNYKLHFQKIRLLFILLFSLFYFDGFAQNINVAVRRDNILFFADPNNGMGFSNGDDCSGGPDLRVFNRLWINGAGPFDDNISYEDHSGVTSERRKTNSPALFNWFVSPVGGISSNSTLKKKKTD